MNNLKAFALMLLAACSDGAANLPAPNPITITDQVSGTEVLLIAVSAVSDSIVWVSGARGTYVRTVDGGATWLSGQVPGAGHLEFRDVHGVDANSAYLMSAGPADSSRIYFTSDAGTTWTLQFRNEDPAAFYDCMAFWDPQRGLAISDPVNGETVLLATSDGGEHWARLPPNLLPAPLPGESFLAASGTCLVTGPSGQAWIAAGRPSARLMYTGDYGQSWSVTAVPLPSISSVSFRDDQQGIVFGGVTRPRTAWTNDGGRTWVPGSAPPLRRELYAGMYVPDASNPAVVVAGPGGLAWSRDGGWTWTVLNENNYWSVGFASPNAGWAVGAEGHITKLSGF